MLAVVCCSLLAACGGDDATESGDSPSPGSSTAEQHGATALGVVEGVVRLAEGATLPRYTPEQIGRRPGQPALPEDCLPALESDLTPVLAHGEGALEGVLVAATGDAETFRAALPAYEPRVREAHIERCRLTPKLLVAVRGDTLRVSNDGDFPFLPTLGETPFLRALMQGQHRDFALDRGGVRTLGCGFAAPCGRTDIVTVYHPVFAVSDAAGHFRLDNVPPGEGVVFHAWHPLFEEARATVAVEAGQTARVELVLRPLPPRPTPPPPEPNAAGVDLPTGDPAARAAAEGMGTAPTMAPATMAPATMAPATMAPATMEPGTMQPGTMQPATMQSATM